MSNRTLNLLWEETIQYLKDLVDEEQAFAFAFALEGGGGGGGGGKSKSKRKKKPTSGEAYDRLAVIYLRYHRVLTQLEKCHDGIVQPQKRHDIKSTLELVVCRIIDLKRNLVELTSIIARGAGAGKGNNKNSESQLQPFPECINIGNILQSMSLSPSDTEAVVPRYFREESLQLRRQMDIHLQEKTSGDSPGFSNVMCNKEASDNSQAAAESTEPTATDSDQTVDSRADSVCNVESQPDNKEDGAHTGIDTPRCTRSDKKFDPHDAAIKLQSMIRGSISRRNTKRHRVQEAKFIGQSSNNSKEHLQAACDYAYTRRKQIQLEHNETYGVVLKDLRDTVREDEGSGMYERLHNERMQWVADQIASTQNIPDSLEAFYLRDTINATGEGADNTVDADSKSSVGKKSNAPSKDGKGKSADKEAGLSEESLAADARTEQILSRLVDCIKVFEGRWKGKADAGCCLKEAHDLDLAKNTIVREEVENAIVQEVDKSVLMYLQRIKGSDGAAASGKSKKGNGGAAKKGKGGKSGKKGGKKDKRLPGEKLVGSMDTSDMLDVLVSSNMAVECSRGEVYEYIGSTDALNPLSQIKAVAEAAEGEVEGRWNRSNPTGNQLRSAIIEYCILPNGSPSIKAAIAEEDNVRSILLYGPKGSGKSKMVDSAAYHLGAILIKLSPQILKDIFLDKSEATRLIHMIFAIARDERNGPVVVHIEGCHEFFVPASGKHVDKSGLVRFQKDLVTYKNQALKKNDRVIIIGTSAQPELMDRKICKWKGPSGKPEKQGFFEKFLYFPAPGYVDRLMLWKKIVDERVKRMHIERDQTVQRLCLDFSLLARSSDGYTAGSIGRSIERVVTVERLQCKSTSPSLEEQLLSQLNMFEHSVSGEDETRFTKFGQMMDEQNRNVAGGGNDNSGKGNRQKK